MDQSKTPLFDRLREHQERNSISFHVPGHKNGDVFSEKGLAFFSDVLKLDATELTGLDDLHSPEGVILEAERLLSDLYRTMKSYFLINGSTVGNLAMILSAVKEDDVVLVQRNSHKSIMNGLKLAKARPVFISPEYDHEYRVAGGVSLDAVKQAIAEYPETKALILTYPNYYGMTVDLKSIIQYAQMHSIPVLVDEAHGVHFIAGEPFPASAVELGADVVVQSAHKTLPAMTMGAFLHVKNDRFPELTFYLQALQSSSPSYPLMASLDLARSYLGTYRQRDEEYLLQEIRRFRHSLDKQSTLRVMNGDDPLKIILQPSGAWSGFELQQELEKEGIFAELADPSNVLIVLPLLKHDMKHRLQEAAEKILQVAKRIPDGSNVVEYTVKNKNMISALALDFQEMDILDSEEILLEEAAGRISAESIIPYPPGIPICLPGEVISREDIDMISSMKRVGAKVQGGGQLHAGKIKVFKSWRI